MGKVIRIDKTEQLKWERHPQNKSGKHQLWMWNVAKTTDESRWSLVAQGDKSDMFWLMKIMLAFLYAITGAPKPAERFFIDVARYLVLSPKNKPVPLPKFSDIPNSDSHTGAVKVALDMLNKMPKLNVVYEGRL